MNNYSLGSFRVGNRYQLLLICIAVLAVYYPTIFAEVSILDDQSMLISLFNQEQFDIKALIAPGSLGGGYYRPLIGASFVFDRFFWSLIHEIMHFENILLHLFNSLLVFGISFQISRRSTISSIIPIVTSFFFALHPLCTESVNWISGRTDLLAGFFVLLATYLIVVYPEKITVIIIAFFLVIIGGLAKETAFAFLPGLLLILAGVKSGIVDIRSDLFTRRTIAVLTTFLAIALFFAAVLFNHILAVALSISLLPILIWQYGFLSSWPKEKRVTLLLILFSCFIGSGFFWMLRRIAFSSDMPRIAVTLKFMMVDVNNTIHVFLGAIGFYIGKMIWPLPLNFAIMEIDPLYSLAGITILVFSVCLILNTSIASGFILASLGLLVPALPIALGRIAWTPFAERYAYMALAFFLIAAGILISPVFERREYVLSIIALLYLVIFGIVVVQRNIIWQKNSTLFADVVQKSPNFKNGRGIYMITLYNQSLFDEATEQYEIYNSLSSPVYDEQPDMVMAQMLCDKKRYDEAEKLYLLSARKTETKKTGVLWSVISFYMSKRNRMPSQQLNNTDFELVMKYLKLLRNIDRTYHNLFRIGQTYLAFSRFSDARKVFEEARELLPDSDPAKKNIDKILVGL